ncbi:UNVERIFIED_CONTAM: dockerin type I repeat protein [Acetivibrio alkalicellulosi]
MKKFICFMFVMFVLSTSIYADQDQSQSNTSPLPDEDILLSVGDVVGMPRDIVEIPIELFNFTEEEIHSFHAKLTYNNNAIDVLSIKTGVAMYTSQSFSCKFDNSDGSIILSFEKQSEYDYIQEDSEMVTIVARIKTDKYGNCNIDTSSDIAPIFKTSTMSDMTTKFNRGLVKIYKFGDINNDGKINSVDCALMKRYLLEIIPFDEYTKHMDLNGDGLIDSSDYMLLKRYVLMITETFPAEEMWVPYKLSEDQVSFSLDDRKVVITLTFPNSGFRVFYNDKTEFYPSSPGPGRPFHYAFLADSATVEAWSGQSSDNDVTTIEISYTLLSGFGLGRDEFVFRTNTIYNPEYQFLKVFKN